MRKPRIINSAYAWEPGFERLRHCTYVVREPWLVIEDANFERFRTHAAAVAWVDKLATALREVP